MTFQTYKKSKMDNIVKHVIISWWMSNDSYFLGFLIFYLWALREAHSHMGRKTENMESSLGKSRIKASRFYNCGFKNIC